MENHYLQKNNIAEISASKILPIEEYRWWYDLIKDNKRCVVQQRLISAGVLNRNHLLNGTFQYNEIPILKHRKNYGKKVAFLVTKPICLAAVFGAHDCIELLYTHGADLLATDVNGESAKFVYLALIYLSV